MKLNNLIKWIKPQREQITVLDFLSEPVHIHKFEWVGDYNVCDCDKVCAGVRGEAAKRMIDGGNEL